jgi:hypothetical protein
LLSQVIQKKEKQCEHQRPIAIGEANGHYLVNADNDKSYSKGKEDYFDQFHQAQNTNDL